MEYNYLGTLLIITNFKESYKLEPNIISTAVPNKNYNLPLDDFNTTHASVLVLNNLYYG